MEEAHLIGAQNLHASQGGSLVNILLSTQPCVPEFNPWSPCPRSGVVARICNSITGVAELGRSHWHGSSRVSETSSQKLWLKSQKSTSGLHTEAHTHTYVHMNTYPKIVNFKGSRRRKWAGPDTTPEKVYRWRTTILRDTRNQLSSEKCKLKWPLSTLWVDVLL